MFFITALAILYSDICVNGKKVATIASTGNPIGNSTHENPYVQMCHASKISKM